jgi:hypothetical protein
MLVWVRIEKVRSETLDLREFVWGFMYRKPNDPGLGFPGDNIVLNRKLN